MKTKTTDEFRRYGCSDRFIMIHRVWASTKPYPESLKNYTHAKIAEDYEKLKEKLDQEIKLLEENSEEEGTRMDAGIEIKEQDE